MWKDEEGSEKLALWKYSTHKGKEKKKADKESIQNFYVPRNCSDVLQKLFFFLLFSFSAPVSLNEESFHPAGNRLDTEGFLTDSSYYLDKYYYIQLWTPFQIIFFNVQL